MKQLKKVAKTIAICVVLVFCAVSANAQKSVKESLKWSAGQIREYLASNPEDTCLYDLKEIGRASGGQVVERSRVAMFNGQAKLFRDTIFVPVKKLQDMTQEEFRAVRNGELVATNADRQTVDGKKIRKVTVSASAGATFGKDGVAPMTEVNLGYETRNWLLGGGVGWTQAWYPDNAEFANSRYSMPYFQINAGYKVWKSVDHRSYIAVGAKGLLGNLQTDSKDADLWGESWGFGGGLTLEGMWGVGTRGWRLGFNAAVLLMPYNENYAHQGITDDIRGSLMFKVGKAF